MRALVVHNPTAGGGRAGRLAPQVVERLRGDGVEVAQHRTRSLEDARLAACQAAGGVSFGTGAVASAAAGMLHDGTPRPMALVMLAALVGSALCLHLLALPKRKFDVIVIDGSEEWNQVRPICFRHAEQFIRPGGCIIVDDSWRYSAIRNQHNALRHQIFESVGPCRPGVTSTDIFFY